MRALRCRKSAASPWWLQELFFSAREISSRQKCGTARKEYVMRFVGTNHQDHRRETDTDSQSSARARLMSERGACSPRTSVAFSALSAVNWLRGNACRLVARSTVRWITKGRQNPGASTHTRTSWASAQRIEDR